jgi:hypothetical protein
MKNFFFLLVFFLFQISFANGQAVDRFIKSKTNVAKNRAVGRTNQEIDNKINEAVDKEFDKLLEKNSKDDEEADTDEVSDTKEKEDSESKSSSKSSARSNAYLKAMGISAPVNLDLSYNYKGFILMDIQNFDEKGKQEQQTSYSTYFNDSEQTFAMEFVEPGKGTSIMIFDGERQEMIILSGDGSEKTGLITPLGYNPSTYDSSADSIPQDQVWQNPNYKKTGKKKTIAGYSCEEYIYEDEESELIMWVTNDLPADLYARMFSLSAFSTMGHTGFGQGFTMEWDMKNKESKERSLMTVKEVNKNKQTTINTKGYQLYKMGGN